MTNVPKAFISHAHEDKDRFVVPFAAALRAGGVDAWLDQWEMVGGDSIVDRIFREGIGQADAIIVIVSRVSVNKRWVKEELDAAIVRRIEKSARLIPVTLDGIEVPAAIAHLLRYDADAFGVEGTAHRVRRTLYGISDKPPLGNAPAYTRSGELPQLVVGDPVDDLVLTQIIQEIRGSTAMSILMSNAIQERLAAVDVSAEDFYESMVSLVNQGVVNAKVMSGGLRWQIIGVPDFVWLTAERAMGIDLEGIKRSILSVIVNDGADLNWSMFSDVHWRTLRAIFNEFSADNLLKWTQPLGRNIHVTNVSPLARRALRNMD
ncbi:toll/interleukin-1 receptor domain-containing protein [Frankia sp. AiPs1]|uniref:toll/interleukin-1 receptor domain-containing protein n=1 Tax=Frankia sp. AiPs1 TaxID=573493 RepID=UPI0020430592|nr:toll/interleukin-1 receptor domain-containing protein [Frankia sp. AiPs1]MCM3920643.1 toll/interleukin-1 receptor domain-containing protein [Frankia sp. AiPs1]